MLSVQRNHNHRCLGSVSRFGSGCGDQLCEVGGADPVRLGDRIGVVLERGRAATAVAEAPAALAAIRQVAEELAVRESMIFLDGPEFTGEPPGYVPSSEAALAAQSVDVVRNLHAAIVPRPRAPWH